MIFGRYRIISTEFPIVPRTYKTCVLFAVLYALMQIRGNTGGVWGCCFCFKGVRTERGVSLGVTGHGGSSFVFTRKDPVDDGVMFCLVCFLDCLLGGHFFAFCALRIVDAVKYAWSRLRIVRYGFV